MKPFAALAALLSITGPAYSGSLCTIVIDGAISTFEHELAHCNGWHHEPDENPDPPLDLVHPFDGRLVVISTGLIDDIAIRFIQYDAEIRGSDKTAAELCGTLWRERRIDFSVFAGKMDRLVGCSVR